MLLVLGPITMYPYSVQSGPTFRSAGEMCIGSSGGILRAGSACGLWESPEGRDNLTVRGLLSLPSPPSLRSSYHGGLWVRIYSFSNYL